MSKLMNETVIVMLIFMPGWILHCQAHNIPHPAGAGGTLLTGRGRAVREPPQGVCPPGEARYSRPGPQHAGPVGDREDQPQVHAETGPWSVRRGVGGPLEQHHPSCN